MFRRIVCTTILLIAVAFAYFIILYTNNRSNSIHKYYRFSSKGDGWLPLNTSIHNVFSNYNLEKAKTKDQATILFLDKFSDQHVFDIVKRIPNYHNKYIYTIVSIDYISSKSKLYEMMKNHGTRNDVDKIFPSSYILKNDDDIMRLSKYMKQKNAPVIFKKNIQQQKGCHIETDLNNIIIDDYVIAQELLRNPYTIDGRKINIRVYLLITFTPTGKMNVYMYNDGFLYYTRSKYDEGDTSHECNITTGYIDRSVYEHNPLTIGDFTKYIGYKNARVFNRNVVDCFRTLFNTIKKVIIPIEKTLNMNKFVIMGADIAVDKELGVKIMEINKGPDLRYKDKRDGNVKYNLVKQSFAKMGIIDEKSQNFITIL